MKALFTNILCISNIKQVFVSKRCKVLLLIKTNEYCLTWKKSNPQTYIGIYMFNFFFVFIIRICRTKKIFKMFHLGPYQRDQRVTNNITLFLFTNREPISHLLAIQKSFLVLSLWFFRRCSTILCLSHKILGLMPFLFAKEPFFFISKCICLIEVQWYLVGQTHGLATRFTLTDRITKFKWIFMYFMGHDCSMMASIYTL